MIPFLFITFLSVFLALVMLDKRAGLNCAFFVITIFLSIRYQWGNDYPAYLDMYRSFNDFNFNLFDIESSGELRGKANEFGWVILNRLFGTFHLGFFGFIIAVTIFENWVIRRTIIKFVEPEYYWIAVFFYVFSTSFTTNASMMRQYLCICLFMLVVELMIDKKVRGYLWWSIGLILCGTTIHRSNIAMLISLPLFYINFKSQRTSYIWLAGVGITFVAWNTLAYNFIDNTLVNILLMDESLQGYATYMYEERDGAASGLGVIFRYTKFILFLYLIPQIEDKKMQTVFILIIFAYFFEAIAAVIPTAGRFAGYFTILNMVMWPWLFNYARENLWMHILIIAQLIISIREIISFFFGSTYHDAFIEYHTIFSAPTWM